MKFRELWFFLLLLISVPAFSQVTYFVKYKSSISTSAVNEKIKSQSIFSKDAKKVFKFIK